MSGVRKKRGWFYRVSLNTSMLLMIAVGVLWVVSFIWYIGVGFPAIQQGQYRVVAVRGGGSFVHQSTADREFTAFLTRMHEDIEKHYGVSGIDWPDTNWFKFRIVSDGTWNRWILYFPLWVPFVVLSVWPTIATLCWYFAKPPVDLCTACGYDLRGSKQSTTCPECGEPIPRPAAGDAGG